MAPFPAALSPPPPSTTAELTKSQIVSGSGGYNYQSVPGIVPSAPSTSSSSSSSSPAENLSPSILVTVLVLATAVIVSASFYLLLRLVSRHCRRHPLTDAVGSVRHLRHNNGRGNITTTNGNSSSNRQVSPEENGSAISSLPLFTFGSITSSSTNTETAGADCAVCLSKFESQDLLRLLPLCCHAFHSTCIDTWLANSLTCPLCRSPIFVSETEILRKILTSDGPRSGSFRIELGSVSRRRNASDLGGNRRSYSVGSFDYIVEEVLSEVAVESTRPAAAAGSENGNLEEKNEAPEPAGRSIATEVSGEGRSSWLREYVERLTWAASSSFRSSGRFFIGNGSRRNEMDAGAGGAREWDLEASRLGDEISEMFRWLSGV